MKLNETYFHYRKKGKTGVQAVYTTEGGAWDDQQKYKKKKVKQIILRIEGDASKYPKL